MPELPDVENFKRYMDRHARNRIIKRAEVHAGRVLRGTSARAVKRALTRHKISRSRRHGKHLFARLGRGPWLAMHFGMTGYFASFGRNGDAPRHEQLQLDFSDGSHFAYVDPRKFGRLRLIDRPDDFIADQGLGPDALSRQLTLKTFRALLGDRRGEIKSALMDQRLIAGIGNVYSDEILFQAGVHPRTRVEHLDGKAIGTLHRTMRRVLKMAIRKGAGSDALFERAPRSYLLRHREAGARCPRCKGKVRTMKAAGRTAYYCPACQKKR
jgi:formamidopyrimidine-DNA glycosylase